ncbi:MAG: hypothetical protein ACREUT_13055 [Steroidobacteraceae bacterium]
MAYDETIRQSRFYFLPSPGSSPAEQHPQLQIDLPAKSQALTGVG